MEERNKQRQIKKGERKQMMIYEKDLVREITRVDFFSFVKEFWSTIVQETPVFNWHIPYLCGEMQYLAERVLKGEPKTHDLVVNIPPGTSKSTICSQMFPAWVWTRMPSAKFICASYSHQVAVKDSLRTRDIVESDLYKACFPDVVLREDENTKGLFTTTEKGFRLSAGIGGTVTGYHGHFLLVDDPLNPEEAYSEAGLKQANRWMETTLPSRKVDKQITPLVLVQQRLHQSDPTGEILDKSHANLEAVRHICLPGELTDKVKPQELTDRYEEGLLDPIRLPRKALDQMRQDLGEYGYASQVLQDPVPLGGGMFKTDRLMIVLEEPLRKKFTRLVRSWDKSSTSKGGAYTVGILMGVYATGSYWVLDVQRGQWSSRQREDIIKRTAEMDGPDVEILVEIEGGSGGKESGESTVANLAGCTVHLIRPTGDKEQRAYPLSSQVGGGNVYVMSRTWTRDFIEELRFFPNSKYKDQVDSASQAFNRLAKKKRKIGGF